MRSDHYQLIHRHYHLLPGETGIYLSTFLRGLGMRLVLIFIPIYIYKLTNKLESAFLFYGFSHFVVITSSILAGLVIKKIGVDWTAFIGSVLRAIFLFLLVLAKNNLFFLWLGPLFWGSAVSFYWLSYHYTVLGAEDGDGLFW